MALQAHLTIGSVFHIPRFPAARVWPGFAAGMALDADVALGVTGLA